MGSELRIQAFDDPSWDPMATLGRFLGVSRNNLTTHRVLRSVIPSHK
jgi:hypothetical protein